MADRHNGVLLLQESSDVDLPQVEKTHTVVLDQPAVDVGVSSNSVGAPMVRMKAITSVE